MLDLTVLGVDGLEQDTRDVGGADALTGAAEYVQRVGLGDDFAVSAVVIVADLQRPDRCLRLLEVSQLNNRVARLAPQHDDGPSACRDPHRAVQLIDGLWFAAAGGWLAEVMQ
jgi:hypothetical protein